MTQAFQTPVAYIVFNRPGHTERSFAALRALRPERLFVIADGPRSGHPTDAASCAAVREIVSRVDWPCDVQCNYASSNLGCKGRVESGLTWVFEHADRAIILEDDCLPNDDFFSYCEALLEHYAEDERVWVVTGNNFQSGRRRGDAAYYFSRYNHVWGWATWRRAWQHYDGSTGFWPDWKCSPAWRACMPNAVERRFWERILDRMHAGEIDSWGYPWMASVWFHGGLTATPNSNLVANIGFGADATHTTATDSHQADVPTAALGPLIHPARVERDEEADRYVFDHAFGGRELSFPRLLMLGPRRAARALGRALGLRRRVS